MQKPLCNGRGLTTDTGSCSDMEWVPCNLCGEDRSKLLFKRKDLRLFVTNIDFCVVQCLNCGLVYLNPRPTERAIHAYYTPEFYRVDLDSEQLLRECKLELQGKYRKVKHLKPGKLLDIGCMKGEFLYFMQGLGWEVRGLEFSSTPPNVFGLDIFYGDLNDAGYLPGEFDLVTLWAVLEHVYDPQGMLREVSGVLRPGGKLVALVTNINSIPGRFMRHDDVPRHTTMFSKETISRMLTMTGFQCTAFDFGNDIFSGSVRGVLNYLVKLLAGEKIENILAQNRNPDWREFAGQLNRQDSKLMQKVNRVDASVSPYLDKLMEMLHLGFIMTVEATKV